ncbi:hypothetical protein D3C72_1739720 [compost metagenome]
MEFGVEIRHHLLPLLVAVCNVIKTLLHSCSETVIQDLSKIIGQEIIHDLANIGWDEFVFVTSKFLFKNFFFNTGFP